jgi:hypothetical protein
MADIRAGMLFLAGAVFIETAMMSALTSFAFEAKSPAGAFFAYVITFEFCFY